MPLEIERRFLVRGDDWKASAVNKQHLRQGYLNTSQEGWTTRLRILAHEEKAWLTLKAPTGGLARHEFEYLIPVIDAESLWKLTPYKLTKTRYELNLNDEDWIIDCFEGENAPLVIAEVELPAVDKQIEQPSWCFQEVTTNKQLSNAALAQTPISHWSTANRLAMNLF